MSLVLCSYLLALDLFQDKEESSVTFPMSDATALVTLFGKKTDTFNREPRLHLFLMGLVEGETQRAYMCFFFY